MKMKIYAKITTKKATKFKRLVGISRENFNKVVDWVKSYEIEIKKYNGLKRRGLNTSKISQEDRVLLTFYYLRHYPTFDNLASIFNISESYCQKIYTKTARILAKVLKLPSRQELLTNGFKTLIIDVSEQQIERPLKHQKAFFSGKKHFHTIKAQLIICALTLRILSVAMGKGRQHDFALFKASRLLLDPLLNYSPIRVIRELLNITRNLPFPLKRKKDSLLPLKKKLIIRLFQKNGF
jgi:hypothetical protein